MTFILEDRDDEEPVELIPKRKAPRPLRKASKPVKNPNPYLTVYRHNQYWRIACRPYRVDGDWCNYLGDYETKEAALEDKRGIRQFDKLCKEESIS